jgi:hypothetical protein
MTTPATDPVTEQQPSQDFDPSTVLNFTPTAAQATGSRDLDAPGFRPMAVIAKVDVFPPSEKYPKEGCLGRIKFTWEVEGTGEILIKRIDFYQALKTGQKMYELLNAIWGKKMTNYTIQALEGCKCPLYLKHTLNKMAGDGSKYCDFVYEDGPHDENYEIGDANMKKLADE